MNVEEADIPASLRSAARHLRHVHLADSNRQMPGRGHTDFVSGFRALRDIGYEGFAALECRVAEPPEETFARRPPFCATASARPPQHKLSGELGMTPGQAPSPTFADVRYADLAPRNVCDIYLPAAASPAKPCPVVVWIHGGAFRLGDKRNIAMPARLIDAGFAIVSINYRLSQQAIWPAQLEDLANAIGFVRANAAEYGFDAGRLAAFGSSAGGHLAAMTGIAFADDPELRIQSVVDWYGPIHFEHMDRDIGLTGVERGSPPNGEAGSPESDLIGRGRERSSRPCLCGQSAVLPGEVRLGAAVPDHAR